MQHTTIAVPGGALEVDDDPGVVWRVAYPPQPWAWTPWKHAHGRFAGRWDDPDAQFRTVYASDTLLTCLLEVLAPFRPEGAVADAMSQIAEDDDDQAQHSTLAVGQVPRDWSNPRVIGTATLTGRYAAVTRAGSLATLRGRFLTLATALGLPDLDAAALKLAEPRELTQVIAGWIHKLYDNGQALLDGVRFDSRHGDNRPVWAVMERPHDDDVSSRLSSITIREVHEDDLAEAFRIHRLTWAT